MTLDPDTMTWTCMVCGDERPDAAISVAHRPIPRLEDLFPDGGHINVRYCSDRPVCAAEAHAEGPWISPKKR
jgi:hypothetical protein